MSFELTSAKGIESIFKGICSGCTTYACCVDCYNSDGFYFNIDPKKLQELKDKYGWNKKGFLGKSGCLVPIEDRAEMCVTFICKERKTPEREALIKASYITETKV